MDITGNISLGLPRHDVADTTEAVAVMCDQARLAERVGFDGVTLSEHHLDFPGYFPNPILSASMILAATDRIWAGPMPTILTMRPTAAVVEDLAWLWARHPGRVAACFAAGGTQPGEHEVFPAAPEGIVPAFKAGLDFVSGALGSGADPGPMAADAAVRAARGRIPLLSAAMSKAAVTRAANLGFGVLLSGFATPDRLAAQSSAYTAAGGTGPVALVRRVWMGTPPAGALESNFALYPGMDASLMANGVRERAEGSPAAIVKQLAGVVERCGIHMLNLRLHIWGQPRVLVDEQIEQVGEQVLPALGARLGWDVDL